jgi:P pilus assembly chaperone PapD
MQNIQKIRSGSPCWMVSLLFLILFSVSLSVNLFAQGNLQVTPHRVVFEGANKAIDINLVNTGQDSANYSITFLQYRVTDEMEVVEITTPDPGQQFADKYIRFFPRTVKLGPGESQVVKLQLVKNQTLEQGEYRSHLYFRALPAQKALGFEEKKDTAKAISIQIIPIFGVSIPVIIKVGESTTTLKITDLKMEKGADGKSRLNVTIRRTGNMSVIGNLSLTHIAADGKETKIGSEPGIVVYTPNALRKLLVDIDDKTTVDLGKGKIRVTFLSQSDTLPVKLAEAELAL